MRRLFYVAASLLLVDTRDSGPGPPRLAQAPAQAPAGPDAVAANLVTTACSACHNLDRVRNKVGDRDAWTATVTGMRKRGAGLTDEQVPLIAEYLSRAAATLPVAPGGGGRGGGGRGGAVAGAPPPMRSRREEQES